MQAVGINQNFLNFLRYPFKRFSNLNQKVQALFKAQCAQYSQSHFWKTYGEEFYTKKIQPLKRNDFLVLSGCICIAVLTSIYSLKYFQFAGLPVAIGLSSFIFLGAFSYLGHRIRKHFDHIAWDHLELIRKSANSITSKNQQFSDIMTEAGVLKHPEFDHLENQRKQLEEEIRRLRSAFTQVPPPEIANLMDSKKSFLNLIKSLQESLIYGREVVDLPILDVDADANDP